MSVKFENIKNKFLEMDDLLYDKEFLSEEENERISEEYLSGDSKVKERILEIYDYEYDEKNYKFQFFKLVPSEISDKELEQYISIKTLESIKSVNEKLDTIKFILLIWFVLTIIGVGLSFLSGLR